MRLQLASFVFLAVWTTAVVVAPSVAAEPEPQGRINSLEAAEKALRLVESRRADVNARFAAEERACYSKFFVNHCIEEAKETRSQALAPLNELELEARRYQRAERAAERDRRLAKERSEKSGASDDPDDAAMR